MIRVYKNGKLEREYPKLELKYPLHCYIAAKTLRHFSRKNWIYQYEVFWVTLQAY